jgi:hypothetical protein
MIYVWREVSVYVKEDDAGTPKRFSVYLYPPPSANLIETPGYRSLPGSLFSMPMIKNSGKRIERKVVLYRFLSKFHPYVTT